MADIKGKTVVVTGASRGIGAVLSEKLAERGAKVAMLARNSALLEEICTRVRSKGGEAVAWKCDVARSDEVNRAMGQITKSFGTVDVLVNNAAIEVMMLIEALDLDKAREMFETNVFGVMNCT